MTIEREIDEIESGLDDQYECYADDDDVECLSDCGDCIYGVNRLDEAYRELES